MEQYKLFDAEYKLMLILWELEPINSTEFSKVCYEKLGWKKSTTFNLLRKLEERNIISNNNAKVISLIKREQVQKYESEALLERAFDGCIPTFISTFLKDRKLSKKESEEIRKMIEEATK